MHRDLKPSNVMVGPFGEAYVMDWGLAARCEHPANDGVDARSAEPPGDVAGTPAYMCPEQARGEAPDPRADVYSAGAILYHVLAGEMPYGDRPSSGGSGLLFDRLLRSRPRPLLEIDPDLPPELVAICEKAMHGDLERRYGAMAEMIDDLRAWLDGRVVHAYESGVLAEARKWAVRNPLPLALAAVVVGGLATLVAVLSESNRALAAEVERTNAEKYVANLHAAAASLRTLETAEAKRRLADCLGELREWEWRHLAHRADSSALVLGGHGDAVTALAFGPDGRRLASASEDGSGRLWRVPTGELVAVLHGAGGALLSVAFDPTGSLVATGAEDGTVALHDAHTGALVRSLDVGQQPVTAVAFDAAGASLVAAARDGTVRVWDGSGVRERVSFRAVPEAASALPFYHLVDLEVSPDGTRLLTGSTVGGAHEWELATGRRLRSFESKAAMESVAYRPDGKSFAVASPDRSVRELDLATGEVRASYAGHERGVKHAVFAHAGRSLVSASNDNTLRVWSTTTARTDLVHLGHDADVTCVAVSPDGHWIASGSRDCTVRLWNARSGAVSALGRDLGWVDTLSVHPTEPLAAAACRGVSTPVHRWVVWDTATGQAQASATLDARPYAVALDPSRPRLWTALEGRGLVAWDRRTGERLATLAEDTRWTALAVARSGALFAASDRGDVVVWDADLAERGRWRAHDGRVASLDLGPGGRLVASASADGTAAVWDAATGELRTRVSGHGGSVRSARLGPDGLRLATASADRTVRLWDAGSGAPLAELVGHEGQVTDVAWHPDGARLASASRDATVRVWRAAAGEALLTLRDHEQPVTALAFTPGGETLVTGSEDETLRLWTTGDSW